MLTSFGHAARDYAHNMAARYDAVARWHWTQGRMAAGDQKTPESPLHAAERGSEETLWGESTSRMDVLGEWGTGIGGKCQTCKALVAEELAVQRPAT